MEAWCSGGIGVWRRFSQVVQVLFHDDWRQDGSMIIELIVDVP